MEHRFRAADIVLARRFRAIIGLKAIAVVVAAVAHTHVRLRVKIFEPFGTGVLTAAPAANSLFTARRSAI